MPEILNYLLKTAFNKKNKCKMESGNWNTMEDSSIDGNSGEALKIWNSYRHESSSPEQPQKTSSKQQTVYKAVC